MDIQLLADRPTAEERAAVDEVLGPPVSSWDGARQRRPVDEHVAFGGSAARAGRHLLLPALHALQDAIGAVSRGGLNYICERLTIPPAEAYGVAAFYHLLTVDAPGTPVAYVCDDIACRGAGVADLLGELDAGREDGTRIETSPCLGQCHAGSAAYVHRPGVPAHRVGVAPASAPGVLGALRGNAPAQAGAIPVPQPVTDRRVLRRVGAVDPASLDSYREHGGYAALAWAVERGPEEIVAEVEASRLMGRGGAAFPAGVKWRAVAGQPGPRYVICNADESEPGTFKDRVLLEYDPFAVIEAMTIAGLAVGAATGYLYIRGEYPLAEERLRAALDQARHAGLLGPVSMSGMFDFDIEIRRGGGAYICGEETALFNSIEGYRGEPRQKPPFPTEAGLFSRPTLVNNVETLVNVLDIVSEGGAAYAATGTESSTGTKLFCLSRDIATPGVYEFPFGITLGDVLEAAGGVTGELAAVLVGGAAGSFIGPDRLDTPLTFEGARAAGISLGSGVVMPFAVGTDFADITRRIAAFFEEETCGQCVPCRVGVVRQGEALGRLTTGRSRTDEVALIDDIARAMRDASICGLGHTASGAIQSAIALDLIGVS
ncbi:MAG: NADH-quinone oxidoreductase subunit E [Acidimicrobiia bacterium]|nr:NADH-quinone oxidoreductase subunit E [Acidimicrobiia bacterium]